jgi:CNT family concentrative nucleoside transporter
MSEEPLREPSESAESELRRRRRRRARKKRERAELAELAQRPAEPADSMEPTERPERDDRPHEAPRRRKRKRPADVAVDADRTPGADRAEGVESDDSANDVLRRRRRRKRPARVVIAADSKLERRPREGRDSDTLRQRHESESRRRSRRSDRDDRDQEPRERDDLPQTSERDDRLPRSKRTRIFVDLRRSTRTRPDAERESRRESEAIPERAYRENGERRHEHRHEPEESRVAPAHAETHHAPEHAHGSHHNGENGHARVDAHGSHEPNAGPGSVAPPPPGEPIVPLLRLWIFFGVVFLTLYAYWSAPVIGTHSQALCGIFVIIGLVALFSRNLARVSWRPLLIGFSLQIFFAIFALKIEITGMEGLGIPDGFRPGYELFRWIASGLTMFLQFGQRGMEFVFGVLVSKDKMREIFGHDTGPVFAFAVLPTLIFVSSFFSVLYYFGILQFVVRQISRVVMKLLGTSGAETLSVLADVFMGAAEAPLIIKPFISRMTTSELLALMVGGMATISGSLMAVYIGFGADPVAILVTSFMAAPASLYLSKLLIPETEIPVTHHSVKTVEDTQHRNVLDAVAGGAAEGMHQALNIAAMLIAFIGLVTLIDASLRYFPTNTSLPEWLGSSYGWDAVRKYACTMLWFVAAAYVLRWPFRAFLKTLDWEHHFTAWKKSTWFIRLGPTLLAYFLFMGVLDVLMRKLPTNLTLGEIFANVFYPLAILMGVEPADAGKVASLLGTKLTTNEFVAFLDLSNLAPQLSQRSFLLATYALTGFANFAAVGIQLGSIAALAPSRRAEVARLGPWALFVGFLVTILNAAIAGFLLP